MRTTAKVWCPEAAQARSLLLESGSSYLHSAFGTYICRIRSTASASGLVCCKFGLFFQGFCSLLQSLASQCSAWKIDSQAQKSFRVGIRTQICCRRPNKFMQAKNPYSFTLRSQCRQPEKIPLQIPTAAHKVKKTKQTSAQIQKRLPPAQSRKGIIGERSGGQSRNSFRQLRCFPFAQMVIWIKPTRENRATAGKKRKFCFSRSTNKTQNILPPSTHKYNRILISINYME